jgi:hypothetical protein
MVELEEQREVRHFQPQVTVVREHSLEVVEGVAAEE